MTKHDELAAARFILWVNHGLDGWHPSPYKREADLVQWIMKGQHRRLPVRGDRPGAEVGVLGHGSAGGQ